MSLYISDLLDEVASLRASLKQAEEQHRQTRREALEEAARLVCVDCRAGNQAYQFRGFGVWTHDLPLQRGWGHHVCTAHAIWSARSEEEGK